MAPYGIKSVFVPANLLREEIRVGYQEGGAEEAPSVVKTDDPAPQESTFEEPADPAVVEEPADHAVVEEEPADEAAERPADESEEEAAGAEQPEEEAEETPAEDTGFRADSPDASDGVNGPLEPVPEKDSPEVLPNLNGGYDEDMEAFDPQLGGGMFSGAPDVFNIMRTMLTSSATGATMPDLFEDAVYETTIIKGHLDSIAQSLAIIAAKYAGPGNHDQGNGRNRGRGDRGGRGRQTDRQDRQGWTQDPELPETPPAWEEDLAAAE